MKKIRKFLKECKYTKNLTRYVIQKYNSFVARKVQKVKKQTLHREGLKIVSQVQAKLTDNNVFFFFDMGTFLGIYREGDFIKHDMDIDVAVKVSSETEKLAVGNLFKSCGAKEVYRFSVEQLGIVEQSFILNDVKFDICYYYNNGSQDICYLMYRDTAKTYADNEMDVVELTCPVVEEIAQYNFRGLKVNGPKDAEKYLACRYGPNWRIPDKNYVYWKGPSTTPTNYKGIVCIF